MEGEHGMAAPPLHRPPGSPSRAPPFAAALTSRTRPSLSPTPESLLLVNPLPHGSPFRKPARLSTGNHARGKSMDSAGPFADSPHTPPLPTPLRPPLLPEHGWGVEALVETYLASLARRPLLRSEAEERAAALLTAIGEVGRALRMAVAATPLSVPRFAPAIAPAAAQAHAAAEALIRALDRPLPVAPADIVPAIRAALSAWRRVIGELRGWAEVITVMEARAGRRLVAAIELGALEIRKVCSVSVPDSVSVSAIPPRASSAPSRRPSKDRGGLASAPASSHTPGYRRRAGTGPVGPLAISETGSASLDLGRGGAGASSGPLSPRSALALLNPDSPGWVAPILAMPRPRSRSALRRAPPPPHGEARSHTPSSSFDDPRPGSSGTVRRRPLPEDGVVPSLPPTTASLAIDGKVVRAAQRCIDASVTATSLLSPHLLGSDQPDSAAQPHAVRARPSLDLAIAEEAELTQHLEAVRVATGRAQRSLSRAAAPAADDDAPPLDPALLRTLAEDLALLLRTIVRMTHATRRILADPDAPSLSGSGSGSGRPRHAHTLSTGSTSSTLSTHSTRSVGGASHDPAPASLSPGMGPVPAGGGSLARRGSITTSDSRPAPLPRPVLQAVQRLARLSKDLALAISLSRDLSTLISLAPPSPAPSAPRRHRPSHDAGGSRGR